MNKAKLQNYNQPKLFYSLALILPWVIWFYVAHLSHSDPDGYRILIGFGGLLGLVAPLLVVLILVYPNRVLRKDVLQRILNFKSINNSYWPVVVFLMPCSILIAQIISLFFGYSTDQFQFRTGYSFTSGIFPVWVILIMAPVIEELAWHSYGTDCLRNKLNLLNTSIIFALFWGIWHFPLSFIKDYYHSNLVEDGLIYSINFFVSLFPFVLIMNWLYYKMNRNILIPILFHISAGYFNELFATEPMSKVIQTGLLILLSIYLIIKDQSFFLKLKAS